MFAKHVIVLLLLIVVEGLNAADSCQTPEGYNGDCQPITQCPYLAKLFDKGPISPGAATYLRLAMCGFAGGTPKVCCPPPRSNLLPDTSSCGQSTQNKISGGERTDLDEFPWTALLHYQRTNGSEYFGCGGALISQRYVMTAAHCINPRLMSVRLGEHDIDKDIDCITVGNDKDCAPPVVDVPVEEMIVHEGYKSNDKNQYHDIAILRLKQEVNVTDYIKPVCLPTTPDAIGESILGKKLFIVGWGQTENMVKSKLKLKAQVPVRILTDCSDIFLTYNMKRTLTDNQLCAGGENGKDSCGGDSGGPLMMIKKNQQKASNWFALGVVSFGGLPCGMEDWPGVYTKVGRYVGWISTKLKP